MKYHFSTNKGAVGEHGLQLGALTMNPKVRQIYPHSHRQCWVTEGLQLHRQSLSLSSLQNGGAEQDVLSRQTDRSEREKGGGRG